MLLPRTDKGITLVELLVTIAIITILATVVIVAADPAELINRSRDANTRKNSARVSRSIEACFTANNGDYTNCDSLTELRNDNYLKQSASLVDSNDAQIIIDSDSGQVSTYGAVLSQATVCAEGTGLPMFWTYQSIEGESGVCCGNIPTVKTDPADGICGS